MRDLDVKIGGNEIDRLRRWHKQGKLQNRKAAQKAASRKPPLLATLPSSSGREFYKMHASLAAVIVRGVKRSSKEDVHLAIRSDVLFPSLYTIRKQGRFSTPVAFATAHVAAQFIRHFPRKESGVFAPESLPDEIRRAILAGVRSQGSASHTK